VSSSMDAILVLKPGSDLTRSIDTVTVTVASC